jgi:hypothetical protein
MSELFTELRLYFLMVSMSEMLTEFRPYFFIIIINEWNVQRIAPAFFQYHRHPFVSFAAATHLQPYLQLSFLV